MSIHYLMSVYQTFTMERQKCMELRQIVINKTPASQILLKTPIKNF